ncbi:MAG: M48 family metalloprotease [Bacteroidota bacterium]
MLRFSGWRVHVLFLTLLLVLTGCGTTNFNPVTGQNQRGAYTWAQQIELGTQADQQISAQYGLLDDPEVVAYVDAVGQQVLSIALDNIQAAIDRGDVEGDAAAFAEIRATPFAFRVLDTPVVNAFALPGGYNYVTRGLLAHLDNEAQLAMVLGHEIGHVLAQHSSRQAFEAQRGQLGLIGAAIAGTIIDPRLGQGILEVGGTGVQLLFLKYGRDAERQADEAGVAYAEFAGYDAAEGARFFRSLARIQESAGGGLPSFLSTHPDPSEREQTIPQLAALYDTGVNIGTEAYHNEIAGIILGENPREGFVEDGVFYHPDLAFRFDVPRVWQVQNTRSAVIMGEPNGNAALQLTLAGQSSASAAAQEFRGQQGVSVTGQETVSFNGASGVMLEGQAQSQQGAIAFLASYIEYGGNVYQMLGLTAPQNYSTYGDGFNRTMRSFARLTDSRYLNRQPVRLDVVAASRTAPFSSFLRGRPEVPGIDDNGLAILNQVGLNDTIQVGTLLKLPTN